MNAFWLAICAGALGCGTVCLQQSAAAPWTFALSAGGTLFLGLISICSAIYDCSAIYEANGK